MVFKKFRKKLFFLSFVFIMLVSVGVLTNFVFSENKLANAGLFVPATKAGDNFTEFAWSENYGWVSFNSDNCDRNIPIGKSDGPATRVGCPSPSVVVANYGVNLNYRTNVLSGYAWNSNVGWINFNTTTFDPATGELAGTAKIVSLGPDGDLRLKDAGAHPFAASTVADQTNADYGKFGGWAWNDNAVANTGIGWLSFGGTATDGSNYFVSADLNMTPTADTYAMKTTAPSATTVLPLGTGFVNEGDTVEFSAKWTDLDGGENARIFVCKDSSGVDTSTFGSTNVTPVNTNGLLAGVNDSWVCAGGDLCTATGATNATDLTCSMTMDGSLGFGGGKQYHTVVCDEFAACTTSVASGAFVVNDRPVVTGVSAISGGDDIVSEFPEVDAGDSTIRFSADWTDAANTSMQIFVCKGGSAFSLSTGCAQQWCVAGPQVSNPPSGTTICDYTMANTDFPGDKTYDIYLCDNYGACSVSSSGTFYLNDRPEVITMEAPHWIPDNSCENPTDHFDLKATSTWDFSDGQDKPGAAELTAFKFTLYNETDSVPVLTDVLYANPGDGSCVGLGTGSECEINLDANITWDKSYSFAVQVKDNHAWSEKTWFDQSSGDILSDNVPPKPQINHTVNTDKNLINPDNTFTTYVHNFPIAVNGAYKTFPVNPSAGEEVRLYPDSKYSTSAANYSPCEASGMCSYAWSISASDGAFKGGGQTSVGETPIVIFLNDKAAASQTVNLTVTEIATGYQCTAGEGVTTIKNLPTWIETN